MDLQVAPTSTSHGLGGPWRARPQPARQVRSRTPPRQIRSLVRPNRAPAPGHAVPAPPKSPQSWPNSPGTGQIRPKLAEFGRDRLKPDPTRIARIWPKGRTCLKLCRARPALAKIDRSPEIGRNRFELGLGRPKLAGIARKKPESPETGRSRRTLVNVANLAKIARDCPEAPEIGRSRPRLLDIASSLTEFARNRSDSPQTWPNWLGTGRTSVEIGRTRPKGTSRSELGRSHSLGPRSIRERKRAADPLTRCIGVAFSRCIDVAF